MAVFTITAVDKEGLPLILFYDNKQSILTYENGKPVVIPEHKDWNKVNQISRLNPGIKKNIKTLKISLGLSCNYSCNYCSQRFVPHVVDAGLDQVDKFVENLPNWFDINQKDIKIEYWGGEPFVYWKTMKPLAEKLKTLMPNASMSIITNGSLLDIEKNEWLEKMDFAVGISHDGPGQWLRGPDPFENEEQSMAIMDLYERLNPKKKISFNVMLNKHNQNKAKIQEWFVSRFGSDVMLGEGGMIDPYDEEGLKNSLADEDHVTFRVNSFTQLRSGTTNNFQVSSRKIVEFIDTLKFSKPSDAIGQKCGMDREDNIAVTLQGNVLTCQNVSDISTSPNGESHKLGNVENLQDVKLKTSTHWANRKECSDCPVLHLCKGACMFLEGELWDKACDNSYSDNIPYFAAAIEVLTGAIPLQIDGPLRESRKKLFW